MANKPIENLIYEFLSEHQADFGASVEIHPSAYEKWNKDSGIVIGDVDSSMLPNGNDKDVTEYNAMLTIEFYARVVGHDKTNRIPARQRVFDLKKTTIELLETFKTLNGRVCGVEILQQLRFFDDTKADKYCVERLPLIINPRQTI